MKVFLSMLGTFSHEFLCCSVQGTIVNESIFILAGDIILNKDIFGKVAKSGQV